MSTSGIRGHVHVCLVVFGATIGAKLVVPDLPPLPNLARHGGIAGRQLGCIRWQEEYLLSAQGAVYGDGWKGTGAVVGNMSEYSGYGPLRTLRLAHHYYMPRVSLYFITVMALRVLITREGWCALLGAHQAASGLDSCLNGGYSILASNEAGVVVSPFSSPISVNSHFDLHIGASRRSASSPDSRYRRRVRDDSSAKKLPGSNLTEMLELRRLAESYCFSRPYLSRPLTNIGSNFILAEWPHNLPHWANQPLKEKLIARTGPEN